MSDADRPNDDLLVFADEQAQEPSQPVRAKRPWKILIVDDDEDVHVSTQFSMRGVEVSGRPLSFLHSYSGAEARQLLQSERDIAVILLDVVMESDDAGLQLVAVIREEAELKNTRIILRTGQPGYAPEIATIDNYDINDYKTKSELTRERLYSALTTAIRSYDQLQRLDANRQGLATIIDATNSLLARNGLRQFASGVITQLSAFAGTEPEGMVCVQAMSGEQGDTLEIIAGAGRYQQWIDHQLNHIDNPNVQQMITECMAQQQTLMTESDMCLYFEPGSDRRYAVYIASTQPLSAIDEHMVKMFCNNISICAQNIELIDKLEEYAFVDQLTGLPNRTRLLKHLSAMLDAPDRQPTVALVDIDQFSVTIDAFGHRYGDLVLQAVAERLGRLADSGCFVARVAGDIFAVVCCTGKVSPEQLFKLFVSPLLVADAEHVITVSAGIARASSEHHTGEELLKDAFVALKRAKHSGQGQYEIFDTQMTLEMRGRAALLEALRQDLEQTRLYLVYQPQLSLQDGSLIGFEALLRWQNEAGDFVPPDRFIPIAEQSGLIISLGDWVLQSALTTLSDLHALGHAVRVAVNVSAVQFNREDYVDTVIAALKRSGVEGRFLELEITETVGILGSQQIESRLQRLRSEAVFISIDDFGTGFSSLSYLENLSADRLKIDKSFIDKLNQTKSGSRIVEMVIGLGEQLGLSVLAEGIETEHQLDELKRLGCHEGQGYLFAKPMKYEELLTWLDQHFAD